MTRQEQAPQRQHQRLQEPRSSSMHTRDGTRRIGLVNRCSGHRRISHSVAGRASICLLVAAIIASPMFDGGVARVVGTAFGVLAAPCMTESTAAGENGGEGGGGRVIEVDISPTSNVDPTSRFNCSGGEFKVAWSGAVNVSGTIYIGVGTTVNIVGDNSSANSDTSTSGTSTSTANSSNNSSSSSSSSNQDEEVDDLTAALSIPRRGLTSAAVGVGGSQIISNTTDTSIAFGPIFFVDGGQLFLENIAIRGGFVTNSTSTSNSTAVSGAGIHAQFSNVTVTNCEFADNFAEFWGGGVYGNRSSLVVVDSVFRRCRAGFQVSAGEDVEDIAGGAIGVEVSNLLIDGCLFEDCYASKKGGAVHQGIGQMSVVGSVFLNNSAGSGNIEADEEVGEGAALSFTTCTLSFDGLSTCGANDTVFAGNRVGRKGGAVVMASGDAPSHVEFHRCTVVNSTTGKYMEDDPQGEGGAFALGKGVTLVLSDCVLTGNYCGHKGGVVTLSSGDDWGETPGATLILRNSTFESNEADHDSGGVVYVGEFSVILVAGDGNVFANNTCRQDGGVFGGTKNTNITVEGGVFRDNDVGEDGGVVWTKGKVEILGGRFLRNKASGSGGVIISADGSTTILAGGVFQDNSAFDGGVVYVGKESELWVEGGEVSDNKANNGGGAFFISEGGNIQITGGNFSSNEADFGGFLYKEGEGNASCEGASIRGHEGVDGGAIYAVEHAELDWACDLVDNEALAGPAIYARDDTTVELRGISVLDNVVARGSAIFVVESFLKSYQVSFTDTNGSSDLSAVQVDKGSTYMAEDTSFDGFVGEAVVFSEGRLFLDDCDFSGSTAAQLVYAEPDSIVVIRNTVLGDNNYLALAKASSLAGERPTAASLTNADTTCKSGAEETDQDESSSLSDYFYSSTAPPCSEDSACVQGDLGVYCECYVQRSTSEQRCFVQDSAVLSLTSWNEPNITFFPDLLEGDLVLSHVTNAASSAASDTLVSSSEPGSSSSGSSGNVTHGVSQPGVVWSVAALQESVYGTSMMNWTVFPSTGLLLLGKSITLRVVTSPNTSFDGTASVTFKAAAIGTTSTTTTTNTTTTTATTTTHVTSRTTLTNGEKDHAFADEDNELLDQKSNHNYHYYHYHGAANAQQAQQQLASDTSSESQDSNDSNLEDSSGLGSDTPGLVSFNVTFYHCTSGQVWSPATTTSDSIDSSEGDFGCRICGDVVEGDAESVDCDDPGATIETLPVAEGYWRAALDVVIIRECSSHEACKGGSTVANVQDYCNEGYMGPECAVCAPGHGRGAANECHRCTTGFKAGMSFVIATAATGAFVVLVLLAVYLVGGRGAVSSKVASTKDSVLAFHRRSTVLLARSSAGGRTDFISPRTFSTGNATSSDAVSGEGIEMAPPRRYAMRMSSVSGRSSSRGSRNNSSDRNNSSGGGGGSSSGNSSSKSSRSSGSGTGIENEGGDRNLEGGLGTGSERIGTDIEGGNSLEGGLGTGTGVKIGGSLLSAKIYPRRDTVTQEQPDSSITNTGGLAVVVPARYDNSGSSCLSPMSAEERREETARDGSSDRHMEETVLDGSSDRDMVSSSVTPSHHRHADSSDKIPSPFTYEKRRQQAYGGPPTIKPHADGFTGNRDQPQLDTAQREDGGPETGVDIEDSRMNRERPQLRAQRETGGGLEAGTGVEGSGRNRERRQSLHEERKAGEQDGDGTAAAKIGNFLAGLPLSKIKIVIVVWQISAAFSNITNVDYPPIYEKFLSIIGMFTLDLAWILSAACLTTNVDFYDKLLMVTIGPIIVLGLLGATFYTGARSTRTVATNPPVRRQQRYQPSQPDPNNALQTMESPRFKPVLQRGKTSGISSPGHNAFQALEPPRSGPVSQGVGTSGTSSGGDTIAFARFERPKTSQRAGGASAAAQTLTTAADNVSFSDNYLVVSRGEHTARRRGAGESTASHYRAASGSGGGGGDREKRQSSGVNHPSAKLDDAAAVNSRDSAMMRASREGVEDSGSTPSVPPGPAERALGRTQRSLRSMWKDGPGNEADPEQDHLWGLFARHTTMTLILLYLIYSQVSTVVFQTFSCADFPEIKKSYLRADTRIECHTSSHTAYRTYAAIMIFIYPLGIPAAFYFLLSRQRSSINPPTDKNLKELRGREHVVQEKINNRSADPSIEPTSFLWNAYYPNRYYYEVFECLRRLVLTGLLVFLIPDTPGQVAFGCVFAFASLLAFELLRPHIDPLEIQLYRTGCLVIFFTNFLALMIKAEVADEHSAGSSIYSVVLILVNIMFFLSIWWNTWATIKAMFTRRGFQGMVVGADVFGEDTVDMVLGPNRKRMRETASRGARDADIDASNAQPAEELLPAWAGNPGHDDMEACVDSSISTRSGQAPLMRGSVAT